MRVRLATIAALLASAVAPAASSAAEPIMKLADVRAGMQCRSLSVIRGTTPSEFQIEVIDVLRGDPETIGARILFRAYGPAVDATGIGPGFSGSPIYCRDGAGIERVAGAISEGIGQYGNHVALATPIEEMLGVRPAAAPRARKATALLRSARPLANPLTVSGLSSPLRRTVLAAARKAGFPLFAAPSASSAFFPPYELTPGTSVAAGISTGDIALGAVGTVTYRDGDKLWAFGHLLDGAGRRSLPLLDAYVFSVIDNPVAFDELTTTYKLATPGRAVGTLTTDGLSAVAGRVGAPPATIPLTVRARNEANGRTRTLRASVADERRLDLGSGLDAIGSLAAGDAIATVLGAVPNSFTTRMCVRVSVRQRKRPLRFCQRYFDAQGPLGDLSRAFSLIDGYKFGPLGVRAISVGMQIRPTVREAFIVSAQAPLRVRRGQRVRLRLRLQRSRAAGRARVSVPYRIPRDTKKGLQILTIRGQGGGGDLGGLEDFFIELFGGGGGGTPTRSVADLARRIAALGKPDGVHATFERKGKGPVVYTSKRLLIRGRTQIPMLVRK